MEADDQQKNSDASRGGGRFKERTPKTDAQFLTPDGGWGWVVCLAAFACNFLVVGINLSNGILFVGILKIFQESVTKTSVVLSVLNGATMMISPLANGFLPFFSHRQIIIAGSVIGTFSTFGSAFVPSIDIMIFTFGFLGGVSLGMVYFASNVIVGLYFTKKRGIAVGLASAGAGIGTFVMTYGIENLIQFYALRGMFILLSGFILNIVVFGALCRPLKHRKIFPKDQNALICEQKKEPDCIDETLVAEQLDDQNEKESMMKTYPKEADGQQGRSSDGDGDGQCKTFCTLIFSGLDISLLKNCDALILITVFGLWSANQIVFLYLPFYVINIGLNSSEAAILMSITGIGMTVGEVLIGILTDVCHIKSDHLMTLSMTVLSVTTFIYPLVSDIYSLGVLVMIWSIAIGLSVCLRVLLAVDVVGVEKLAPLYSYVMFATGLAYSIFPIFFGWLYDVTRSFIVVFMTVDACIFIGLILSFFINYRLKRRISQNTSHQMHRVTDEVS